MTNDWETIEVQSILDENAKLRTENEKIKQQRDFYYARLQKIIKIADGDWE